MFRSKTQFERVFEKATSNLLLEPDLDSMLQLCDMIRGGDIKAKEACGLIKTRVLEETNPHVQFFSVVVLDTVMKNCGEAVHNEVLTESYMESIKELVKSTKSENVKNKLLEMIQAWGVGFKESSKLKVASNLYNIMKAEGYKFPPVTDTSDMFKSEKAPTWSDGDECSKCKAEFGLVQRKHHCRACGNIFCNKCSSKQAIIPKYGIEKEVRVCDACYAELVKKSPKSKSSDNDLPAEYLNSDLAKESQQPPKRNDLALKEEEELQLALALSLDEQENKHKIRKDQVTNDPVYSSVVKTSTTAPSVSPAVDPETDPDLARYLNRFYWDSKKQEQESQDKATKAASKSEKSPEIVTENFSDVSDPTKVQESLQNGGVPIDMELVNNLRTSVEIFVNRMRSDEIRGRSIANDSTVQSLFQSINNMHPTLIQYMNELEEKRLHQEALQDKLVQIRDARAALDALRAEHAEKLRRAAEEAHRQRQIQMAQKLEVMRQKKQEYLAYQRQLALQRMQEQEAARQARLEQHKQLIQQKAMQPSMLVAGYNTQYGPLQTAVADATPTEAQAQSGYYTGYSTTQQQPYVSQNMQYPSVPQANAMYAQQTGYSEVTYQQPSAINGQGGMPVQQNQPVVDHYNMSEMSGSLPSQQSSMSSVSQHVVASAPPPTPQPAVNNQQMMTAPVDPNAPQYQGSQQGYYQQPMPSQAPPANLPHQDHLDPMMQQNQGLLISFD